VKFKGRLVQRCITRLRSKVSAINKMSDPRPWRSVQHPVQLPGFHICGQTWKTGKFLVLRKTIHQRLSAKLRALKEELRRRRHLSVAELGKWLRSVVQGYFTYHTVPGNLASLRSFRLQVIRRWMRALRRRSQKSRMTWPRLVALAERWLPEPSILHPYPNLRFDAKHPR
jgi:RNA-directed DNA polymerase